MLKNDNYFSFKLSDPKDLPDVLDLLQSLQLPTEGVQKHFGNFFVVRTSSAELIGCAGLEIYDQFGLLRSAGLKPGYQGRSLGLTLVQKIESLALKNKVTAIYLLTETAEGFFSKHGYKVVERMLVPKEIQKSYEYSKVCQQTAIVMYKTL